MKETGRIPIDYETEGSKYTSQSEALLQLIVGNNVFLSGPAGSGKSYIIRKYCDLIQEINPKINIYRTSTTGLSALNIKGDTIQSYSGQGIAKDSYEELKDNHSKMVGLWNKSEEKIRLTDVLIIDEISMFSESSLEFLLERMKDLFGVRFNRVQIIVAGDFSQLAPVATTQDINDYGQSLARYCYGTKAWNEFHFVSCYLDKIYRTNDKRLQYVLAKITNGCGNTDEVKNILRTIPTQKTAHVQGVPVLLSTNRDVKKTNEYWQNKNQNQEYFFETDYSANATKALVKKAKHLAKEKDVEKEIRIKVNDTIMITTNDTSNEDEAFGLPLNDGPTLKNGMIGTFLGLLGQDKDKKPGKPKQLSSASKLIFSYESDDKTYFYHIQPYSEKITTQRTKKGEEAVITFRQYPIKLAYAISIHKSQGQTFSKIAIDLKHCWTPGLGYVALSRATSIKGINLIKPNDWEEAWNTTALRVDNVSTQIKKSILVKSTKLRKYYTKVYPIIAYDARFIVQHRNRFSLQDLIIAAAKNRKSDLDKS